MLIENDEWIAHTHPEQVSSFATTHRPASEKIGCHVSQKTGKHGTWHTRRYKHG